MTWERMLAAAVMLLAAVGSAPAGVEPQVSCDGADLVQARCVACHAIEVVTGSAGISAAAWRQVLADMEQLGLRLSADERGTLLGYLITHLGPDAGEGESAWSEPDCEAIEAEPGSAPEGPPSVP